jgi:hypothetical protein
MSLTLLDVRRLAIEVARAQDDALEVLGVVTPSGGSGYTEVLISQRGCPPEDGVISVGLDRQTSEESFRTRFAGKLRTHPRANRRADAPRVRAAGSRR